MSYIKNIIEGIIEENPSLTKKAIESALYEKMAERLELAREQFASVMLEDEEDICEDCEEEMDWDEEVLEAKDEDEEDEDEDEEDEDEDEDEEEMDEEFEQIDELSPGTVQSYAVKAKAERTSAGDEAAQGTPGAQRAYEKRSKGLARARRRGALPR